MSLPPLPQRNIASDLIQICFVVKDLELAMVEYSNLFGAGPWFIYEGPPDDEFTMVYRGEPTHLGARVALAYAGNMMFELVCPRDGMPSIFREVAEKRGYGLHHFGFGVRDYDATVAALNDVGLETLCTGVTPRGARAIMVQREPINAIEEYIELLPASDAFYALMKKSNAEWDRKRLIYNVHES